MDTLIAAIIAGLTDGAAIGLVALGFVIVYKATRVLNFGQAEIGTLAIYIEWEFVNLGLPVILAILLALIAAAGLGLANERLFWPLAAAPRLTVTVASIGVTTILVTYQILRFSTDPRTAPQLVGGDLFTIGFSPIKTGRVLALVVTIALGALLYTFFKRSLFGLGVLAVAQDQTALRLQGLPIHRVSGFVWATGAAVCALAAMIIAPTLGTFYPGFLTVAFVPAALAAALVGGLTSLPGAFVGGIAIGLVQNLTKFYISPLSIGDYSLSGAEFLAVFLAMTFVLLFRPNGLLGAKS